MRILIATLHRKLEGGVETYLRDLLPALRESGHEVGLLHEHPAPPGCATVDGMTPGLPVWWTAEPVWREHAKAFRPDIVYAHGLESADVEESLLRDFPTILFAHNYHGTCISGTKRESWPGFTSCERVLGAGCLLRYLPRRCGGLHPGTMLTQYRLQQRRAALLTRYRAVLVASRHMEAEYRRHGVAAERLHLVPYFPAGSSPDVEPPEEKAMTGTVLLVGRLTSLKGGCLLVEALNLARTRLGRPLELVVAGDGAERSEIQKQAEAQRLPVRFLGWIDAVQRTELMRSADVLAVPSLWPEPFGLVGIEAGCVGLPAAGFAVGGIPDWLTPGISGESAPADAWNADGLADAVVRVLRDPAHWQRLRRGAWETARRFPREAHLAKLQTTLRSCLQGAA